MQVSQTNGFRPIPMQARAESEVVLSPSPAPRVVELDLTTTDSPTPPESSQGDTDDLYPVASNPPTPQPSSREAQAELARTSCCTCCAVFIVWCAEALGAT